MSFKQGSNEGTIPLPQGRPRWSLRVPVCGEVWVHRHEIWVRAFWEIADWKIEGVHKRRDDDDPDINT